MELSEEADRMVQGRRAAGVARRGHSQEIFRIPNQQDSMPFLVGGRRERMFEDPSQVPPTELEKTGRVHLGVGGSQRDEDLIWRQVTFEEPKDTGAGAGWGGGQGTRMW